MNTRRTPGWVLSHDAKDELTGFLAHTSSTGSSATPREPLPIQLESDSMPADDGLRLHEHQHLPPRRPESSQHHPEPFVGNCKPDLRTPPFQCSKLLPKSKVI
jgi:hypothetical protein